MKKVVFFSDKEKLHMALENFDISSFSKKKIPVKLHLFDILYLNGESLISMSYVRRRQVLTESVGEIPLTKQLVTDKAEDAEQFLKDAIDAGHEGLVAKKLDGKIVPHDDFKKFGLKIVGEK